MIHSSSVEGHHFLIARRRGYDMAEVDAVIKRLVACLYDRLLPVSRVLCTVHWVCIRACTVRLASSNIPRVKLAFQFRQDFSRPVLLFSHDERVRKSPLPSRVDPDRLLMQ